MGLSQPWCLAQGVHFLEGLSLVLNFSEIQTSLKGAALPLLLSLQYFLRMRSSASPMLLECSLWTVMVRHTPEKLSVMHQRGQALSTVCLVPPLT